MKLNKFAVAAAEDNVNEIVKQMIDEGSLPEDWGNCINDLFKQLASKGETELLALFATACICVLDLEQFECIETVVKSRDKKVSLENAINYTVLNKIDEKLQS